MSMLSELHEILRIRLDARLLQIKGVATDYQAGCINELRAMIADVEARQSQVTTFVETLESVVVERHSQKFPADGGHLMLITEALTSHAHWMRTRFPSRIEGGFERRIRLVDRLADILEVRDGTIVLKEPLLPATAPKIDIEPIATIKKGITVEKGVVP